MSNDTATGSGPKVVLRMFYLIDSALRKQVAGGEKKQTHTYKKGKSTYTPKGRAGSREGKHFNDKREYANQSSLRLRVCNHHTRSSRNGKGGSRKISFAFARLGALQASKATNKQKKKSGKSLQKESYILMNITVCETVAEFLPHLLHA